MRTLAAARLELRLAAARASEKISSCICISTLAAAEADVWKKKKKGMILESESESEKSLYLGFFERIEGVNQVVGPISLKNSDSDSGGEESLTECKKKVKGDRKSQILFPFHGTAIKYQHYTTQFSGPKIDPMVGELNGKLYSFDDTCSSPFFKVKDKDKGGKWQPLANPPFTKSSPCWGPGYISILEGSNKILAWQHNSTAVYCFDVTNPGNGWTESSSSLANTLPFLSWFNWPPTFIHHHPYYLIFNAKPFDLLISAFFMSAHDSHSVLPIDNQPIQLPHQYCSKYVQECFGLKFIMIDHRIVHLGGQRVCLILNKFLSDQKTAILLLLTFEYDIIPNGVGVNIQTRFLGTRHFRYKPVDKETLDLKLTGAFVL